MVKLRLRSWKLFRVALGSAKVADLEGAFEDQQAALPTGVAIRRRIIGGSLAAVIAGFLVGGGTPIAAGAEDASRERPNVVLIFSDDQGVHDVGCYGSEIATPRIDQLAKQGIRFTQFYAASSICTPSRYGLLTGRFPHRSRDQLLGALMFLDEADAGRGIREGETTFVARLRESGYRTALVGKWHLGHGQQQFWPTEHGFESFFGHTGGCVDFFTLRYGNRPDWYRGRRLVETDGYATDVITDEAISILRAASQADAPLYLQVAYNAPHFGKGWDPDGETTENVMQPKPDDLINVRHVTDPLRRSFAAKVVGMDTAIGRLVDTIDALGMRRNTMVIFMTDHGGDPEYGGSNLPFRGGKATLFEGGIRVPCVVRMPGTIPAGVTSNAVACAIDWSDTLSELCGVPFDPASTDGESILSVLRGENFERSGPLVWITGAHRLLERESWMAVREADWKWVAPPGESPMLFDLKRDPGEGIDLSDRLPEVASRLKKIATDSVSGDPRERELAN
jgi:arylsulfatase A-like enzyme